MSWLLVPLDDRPCCWRFPQQLAPIVVPPREYLGRFQQPGNSEALLDWLEREAPAADGCVIALDMISWGGLVGSRQGGHSLAQAERRLARLQAIPGRKLAFQSILRNAPTQTTAEEMRWAEALVQLSESLGADAALRQQIPGHVLDAYLATRGRNAELYRFTQTLHLDYLLYALDDSRTRGWNLQELHSLGPVPNVPGTDETALLLLVRALVADAAVSVVWSCEELKTFQGGYEDRPFARLLDAHLDAAGVRSRDGESRQLWLFGRSCGEQLEARVQAPGPIDEGWLDKLERALNDGAEVVLVDATYANGGDLSLGEALLRRGLWGRLRGYCAWNTLGNRLGTALANLLLPVPDPAQFLLERICDDLLYQARYRWQAADLLGHPGLQVSLEEQRLIDREVFPRLLEALGPYAVQVGRSAQLSLALPWSRLFEVEITA